MSVYHHINSFEDILSNDIAIQRSCLDELVKNINEIKEKAIYDFLNDSGSEDFLWSLIKLLSSDDLRYSLLIILKHYLKKLHNLCFNNGFLCNKIFKKQIWFTKFF